MTGIESLAALVRNCGNAGVTRRVLLLRTDRLPTALARPHHLRLARAALDPLLQAERALLHDLPDHRVAVSWRGDAGRAIEAAQDALAHLLADAPPGTPEAASLLALYALPQDGPALLAAAGAAAAEPEPPAPPATPPMGTSELAAIEAGLAGADVSRFARRKPVHEWRGEAMAPAWEKRTLSMAELAGTLAPGCDPQADPWLFRRLTRTLDLRMLSLLAAPGELRGAGPFSLNLNVGSILSPEFLRLDAALPPALRGQVVLDVHPSDMLADPAAFAFARGFARVRRYRVLLRGVTAALLPLLDLDRLAPDLVQLRWSAELGALSRRPWPPGRLLLARADEPEALRWGLAHGVRLFAGHAVQPTMSTKVALGERPAAA